jgi:hypothetical protein
MKTVDDFNIKYVFLAYVPPYDEVEPVTLQTEILKKESRTTEYLFKIFDAAMNVANIEILFTSNEKQENEIRSNILSLAQKTSNPEKSVHAKKLSNKLYAETDERNGSGLFAIMQGEKAGTTRIVLLRLRGDEGLYNHGKQLLVDYIPEVFTRKSKHYKLTVYQDILSGKSFWKGYTVDKQISALSQKPVSFFWVERFLQSHTALTPKQGTMQFSKVIKTMLNKTEDVSEQEQIISGVVNLRNKHEAQISIADFCKTYLSETLATKIKAETANDDFYHSVFVVDPEVYSKEFGKTVLSLQDGITAYVPTFHYDKHVTETQNKDGSKQVNISAKLRGKKINVQKKEQGKNAG